MTPLELEQEVCYSSISALGQFVPLSIGFDEEKVKEEIESLGEGWEVYNPRKPHYRRKGLSLTSLDGSVSGRVDLDSLLEHNKIEGTSLDEMSFKTKTKYWNSLNSISEPLRKVESFLGRSHIIKFEAGGFFPPHRDYGNSFRLIAFFNNSPNSTVFLIDDKKVIFQTAKLYFADTRKVHSIFSFENDSMILVLNVELCMPAVDSVYGLLEQP